MRWNVWDADLIMDLICSGIKPSARAVAGVQDPASLHVYLAHWQSVLCRHVMQHVKWM